MKTKEVKVSGQDSKTLLYKEGAKTPKTAKTKVRVRQNVTVTIDTLVLFFPVVKQFEEDLLANKIQLTGYSYTIQKTSGKNAYEYFAKFYFGDLFLGNLFIDKKNPSKYLSGRNNTFQIAKERFYTGNEWIGHVEELFKQLDIKFKPYRLDVALDFDKDLLNLFSKYYLKEKGKIVGQSKEPTYSNDKQNEYLANVRYVIDENRKIIVLYYKDFGVKRQGNEESQTANASYKRIQEYQIDYWQKNGLKNNKVSRLEIRLFTKYIKIKKLEELKSKALLLALIKKNVGKNMTFRKGAVEKPLVDFDNLRVNNKVITIEENIEFILKPSEKNFLKTWYRAKSVKQLSQVSAVWGVVDLGDGLIVLVLRNLNEETKRHAPVWVKEYFSKGKFERKRPVRRTKQDMAFDAALKKITPLDWEAIDRERNELAKEYDQKVKSGEWQPFDQSRGM